MTKKDYELIARVLRDESSDGQAYRPDETLCLAMADALAEDNPRFDRVKFLVACGVNVERYDFPPSDDHIVASVVAKLYGDEPNCLNCEVARLEAEQR